MSVPFQAGYSRAFTFMLLVPRLTGYIGAWRGGCKQHVEQRPKSLLAILVVLLPGDLGFVATRLVQTLMVRTVEPAAHVGITKSFFTRKRKDTKMQDMLNVSHALCLNSPAAANPCKFVPWVYGRPPGFEARSKRASTSSNRCRRSSAWRLGCSRLRAKLSC